ncbi:MAG: hypothetical protein POELPBGB_00106 [Bacteroidia bacterium]|nr:hypothetical protein [Bacteroidia bacterium]
MDLSIFSFRQKLYFLLGTILQKIISFIPNYRDLERIQKFYYEIKEQGFTAENVNKNEFLIHYKIEEKQVGSIIRKTGSDNKIFTHLILWKDYLEPLQYIKTSLSFNKPIVFFDCGGNIGLASIYFSAFFPNITVVGVEPFRESFDLMNRNISLNNIKVIKLYERALWNKVTNLSILNDYRDKMEWSFRVMESNKSSIQEIKSITLKEMCKENNITNIDILKIDIEGAEKEVVLECEENKAIFLNTKCVFIEPHDDIHPGVSTKIAEYFESLGFHTKVIHENIVFINSAFVSTK